MSFITHHYGDYQGTVHYPATPRTMEYFKAVALKCAYEFTNEPDEARRFVSSIDWTTANCLSNMYLELAALAYFDDNNKD